MYSFQQFQRLDEALDRPLPWRWVQHGPTTYKATFSVPNTGVDYDVWFVYVPQGGDKDYWECTFDASRAGVQLTKGTDKDAKFAIMGTRGEFQVFATVMDVLRAFLKIRPEDLVSFKAKEPSRQRLYATLVSRMDRIAPGWKGYQLSPSEFIVRPDFLSKARPRARDLYPLR